MQGLLYAETSKYDDGFDDFELEKIHVTTGLLYKYVAMFRKQANNGKYIYLVGDRYLSTNDRYLTVNLLEFKHARDRAEQEYQERVNGR